MIKKQKNHMIRNSLIILIIIIGGHFIITSNDIEPTTIPKEERIFNDVGGYLIKFETRDYEYSDFHDKLPCYDQLRLTSEDSGDIEDYKFFIYMDKGQDFINIYGAAYSTNNESEDFRIEWIGIDYRQEVVEGTELRSKLIFERC